MKKKIFAVFGIITITAAMLAGCSSKDVEADAKASTESVSQTVSVSDTAKASESTTTAESTSKADESTTAKGSSTATTKKAVQTTTKAATKTTVKQTERAAVQTTKQTTTKTTTKATTTVKNVSAKDVQAQVNAYIRSKGITVDSSLNSGNSGWSGEIAGEQVDLNNGYSLRTCKAYVDMEIASLGKDVSMYCYYSNETFYICYMMIWG